MGTISKQQHLDTIFREQFGDAGKAIEILDSILAETWLLTSVERTRLLRKVKDARDALSPQSTTERVP